MTADWVDALAAGDRRSWREFRSAHPGARPAATSGVSAGQLACARLLAQTSPTLPDLQGLLALVLATPAAGRGTVDLPVAGAPDRPLWGPAPVEPDDLDPAEVLRVAVPVLARLLPAPPPPVPARRTPLRARRFVVHGAPSAAAAVADALTAAGWVHGPFRATHLVLACPPDAAVEQLWSRRVAHGGTRGWRRTWGVLHATGAFPPALDVATLTARVSDGIAQRHRSARLRLVVGADVPAVVTAALADLGVQAPAVPPPVDAATTDLQRRLNGLPGGARGRDTGWVRSGPAAGVPPLTLGVPSAHRSWAAAQADRLALEVAALAARGDYAVLGDPGSLARLRPAGLPDRVPPAATLDRALAAIARAWRTGAAGRGSRDGTSGTEWRGGRDG